jgi:hypothetical protein
MAGLIPKLIQHLDAHHAALHAAVAAIPKDLRETPPPDGGWSVAQIVEHMTLVDRRFGAMLARAIASAPATAEEPEPDSVLQNRKVLAALNRSVKVESQEQHVPSQGWNTDQALQMLDQAHAELLEVVRAAQGKALHEMKHSHYVLGELNLFQWIAFAGTHEARHAAQILDIGVALGCTTS